MPDVPIREVVCHNCSDRTFQRPSALEPVIWLQAVSSDDGIYINYACPVCNKLTRSRVGSEAKILPEVNLEKSRDDRDLFIVFLKCSKAGCESPVILLAPVKTEVRDGDLIAHIHENWSIHGAACAKGYPPAHPYEVRIWKPLESKH
jgi:hypothetical protein